MGQSQRFKNRKGIVTIFTLCLRDYFSRLTKPSFIHLNLSTPPPTHTHTHRKVCMDFYNLPP